MEFVFAQRVEDILTAVIPTAQQIAGLGFALADFARDSTWEAPI